MMTDAPAALPADTADSPLRILVVEDIALEAKLVEEELLRGGLSFTMERVATAVDLQANLEVDPPDLVLADYMLPGFDGLAALHMVKEQCPDVPFILISGRISEEMAIQAVAGGATDYVFKHSLSRLVPSVHRALREVAERTQRRQAQEALRSSEIRYRLIVEHSHDAIFQLGRDGTVVFANLAVRTVFGYGPEEFLTDPGLMHRVIKAGETRTYASVLEEFQQRGRITEGAVEWMWTHRDGQQIYTHIVFTNLVDDEGRVMGLQLIIRDITELKEAHYQLHHSYNMLSRLFGETVTCLTSAVEKRDPYTGGHQQRVAHLSHRIALQLGLPNDQVEGIYVTGLLHDIGKIVIPAAILSKPGTLTNAEMAIIRTHPQVGYDILKGVGFPWLVSPVVLQHHERLDGSGYPAGLAGDEVLLEARVLAVADVVEAMASHRPYRPELGLDLALAEVEKGRDTLFDPAAVDACLSLFREHDFLFQELADENGRALFVPPASVGVPDHVASDVMRQKPFGQA
ncbi:MAG: HD domain-containing protein [Candidatus Brocadiae bacterium]|nr:HD domain-containing protein [Candidatus Brocadiia bacterium]